jgi:hypothetical protein
MVVGLYGLLYAYAAVQLDRAKLIIAVGLAGKILGPIGMFIAFQSGEWPLRAVTLIVFNDFAWWLPFTLFLFDGTRLGERLRASAPWTCAILNAAAAVAMLLVLRGGTETVSSLTQRTAYIAEHALLWRAGWGSLDDGRNQFGCVLRVVGRVDLITSPSSVSIDTLLSGSRLRSLCRIASDRLATRSN